MRIEVGEHTWNVNAVEGGCYLDAQDKTTQTVVSIPFGVDAVPALIRRIVETGILTPEMKRDLAPLFNDGPFQPGHDYTPGPQG